MLKYIIQIIMHVLFWASSLLWLLEIIKWIISKFTHSLNGMYIYAIIVNISVLILLLLK